MATTEAPAEQTTKTSPYKIEKGVALPTIHRTYTSKYPLAEMEVNDSFLVPDKTTKSVQPSITTYKKKNPKARFALRSEGEGCRVFRLPDVPDSK